ncbi:MAG: dihydroneopterin triphosphate diphosphatase [Burkholderiales bacterium]
MNWKLPVSVLVVIHTPALEVLLLERAAHPGFWQSVTGSLDGPDEAPVQAARREVLEESGIDATDLKLADWRLANAFEIYAHWRGRFAPGTTHNTEHVFGLTVPDRREVRLAPDEHRAQRWLPWREAAAACFSWSNRDAIRMLPARVPRP